MLGQCRNRKCGKGDNQEIIMKIAYIVGPYRSKEGMKGVVDNIQRAEEVALKYWKKGYAVICPHKNTALMDGVDTDDMFLIGDHELVKRSDVVVAMKGWKKSKGGMVEVALAKKLGKKIIYE